MKVVVAGGSGMVGRALSAGLADAGHDVVVLSRHPERHRRGGAGIRIVAWAPPSIGAWANELDGAGAVINLAGESVGRWPWTKRRKQQLRDTRLIPTQALVAAIEAVPPDRRPRVLFNASGTDGYEGSDSVPADESTPFVDTFLAHLCRDWEAAAVRAESLGLRVVLLRMSLVVARGAASLGVLALPFRFFLGGRIGSGRQWMSWIDRRDAVGMVLWALESDTVQGPVNVAAPDPRTQADFGRALGRALRRPFWFPTPAWLVRLVLGEQATLALGSRRVWPARALALGFGFRHGRLEEALADSLG